MSRQRDQIQNGSIRLRKRKKGDVWDLLYRVVGPDGKIIRPTRTLGTLAELPTQEDAQMVANRFLTKLNEERYRQPLQLIPVGHLLDHFIQTELVERVEHRKYSTRKSYSDVISLWLRPHWSTTDIREIRTTDFENWLRTLRRADGEPLANGTLAKIRSVMKTLFNHAKRHSWFDGDNPINLVRQKGNRKRPPDSLTFHEIPPLLSRLHTPTRSSANEPPDRIMVKLDITTAMRKGELQALMWFDFDFLNLNIHVQRAMYAGVVDTTKTDASDRILPLDPDVAKELLAWREVTPYSAPTDWVFASPRSRGRRPYCFDTVMKEKIVPAAASAGIEKKIGWHTLRHTNATLLEELDAEPQTIQDMLGHASPRTTKLYVHRSLERRRKKQRELVLAIQAAGENEPLNYGEKMPASVSAECDALLQAELLM